MNSVKINRAELLLIVLTNKEKHVREFDEAVADYKNAVVKIAEENLALAKTGNLDEISRMKTVPSRPNSYETSYTRAIRMLQLSVDSEIELTTHDFDQLVLDEWQWKASFSTAKSTYKNY